MFKIKVTDQNIDQGLPGESEDCPIALALWDKGYGDICVGPDSIDFTYKKKQYGFDLPIKVQRFIKRFDNDEQVNSFKFNLSGGKE